MSQQEITHIPEVKHLRIQSRIDTKQNWYAINPVLLEREIGYEIETGQYKIGDNITPWRELPYSCNIEKGKGENTIQQKKDAENWTPNNIYVQEVISNNTPNTDGYRITTNENGDKVLVGAFGKNSTMMNGKSQTVGGKSHAEGSKNIAFENNSHAEGNETFAGGQHSHAEGNTTSSIGNSSHAEGHRTQAVLNYSHAEGDQSIAEGEASHAEGNRTHSVAYASHAEGQETKASGQYAHAEGYKAIASGDVSHAEGGETTASANCSHAEGQETEASGFASHAEGKFTHSEGMYSHAEGFHNTAHAESAHTEGQNNHAKGMASHVEGHNCIAEGDFSHAEGAYNIAEGKYSHSEGDFSHAIGPSSHTEGTGTIAKGIRQHVEGAFNKIDEENKYIHIAGNGADNDRRSNAHTLDWNGNAWFANNILSQAPDSNLNCTLSAPMYVGNFHMDWNASDILNNVWPTINLSLYDQYSEAAIEKTGTIGEIFNPNLFNITVGWDDNSIKNHFESIAEAGIQILSDGQIYIFNREVEDVDFWEQTLGVNITVYYTGGGAINVSNE